MIQIGASIGSYRITRLLGEGGTGVVYQATDNIEREVALKALRPFSGAGGQTAHDQIERFRAEAMALGRLHHPNIASLFHLLEEDGAFYLVMELVNGETLEELLARRGALPPRLALELLIDALHGFEHAHERGVIHRDIKASNLMISGDGATKIMDFGIAHRSGGARLTQTGQPLGTLPYMSPEQVRGLEPDARSDLYSLGILGFELLTGRVPFAAASDYELMREHLEKAPPPARFLVPSLPPELDEVLAKTLAKVPSDRFQSASELRQALETIAADLPLDAVSSGHSLSQKSPPTAEHLNGGRYATAQLEDRYATRVQGTPLPTSPVAPSPVAPSLVAPSLVAPAVAAPPSAAVYAPQPTSKPWLWPAVGAISVAVSLATAAVLRPTAKPIAPAKRPAPRANRASASRLAVRRSPRAAQHRHSQTCCRAFPTPYFDSRAPRCAPRCASRCAPHSRGGAVRKAAPPRDSRDGHAPRGSSARDCGKTRGAPSTCARRRGGAGDFARHHQRPLS